MRSKRTTGACARARRRTAAGRGRPTPPRGARPSAARRRSAGLRRRSSRRAGDLRSRGSGSPAPWLCQRNGLIGPSCKDGPCGRCAGPWRRRQAWIHAQRMDRRRDSPADDGRGLHGVAGRSSGSASASWSRTRSRWRPTTRGVRELLHQRLAADARAAGIHLRIEASESASSPSESRISRVLGRSTKRSAGEPAPDQATTSSSSTRAA